MTDIQKDRQTETHTMDGDYFFPSVILQLVLITATKSWYLHFYIYVRPGIVSVPVFPP